MMIMKRCMSRRTVLRGLGATVALPMLESMVPAFAATRDRAAAPGRLGIVYVPNGIGKRSEGNWTPAGEGAAFEFTRILKPLEPFRDQLLVLTGLGTNGVEGVGGTHAGPSTKFLTITNPKRTFGSAVEAGISMDQIVARELGQHTQLASLEVALESFESAGSCDVGLSCAYTNTISWRSPTIPLPMEHNPRAVFERLFGDSGSTSPAARMARLQHDRSILDSVRDKARRLERELGSGDRAKLGEYLEAIWDVERRIKTAEDQSARELPTVEQPIGVPATFEEHAKLMFDLQVLAYQSDLTRVITFMIGREFSGRTYPEVGAPDAHHPTSHHEGLPDKLEKVARINTFHTTLFAYYLEKLRATPDGDGSLLDHMILLYGAGMGDGNTHDTGDLPVLLVGGGGGQLKGGAHVRYPAGTPMANLHLTLMDTLGLRLEQFGNSTGRLEGLFS